MTRRRLQRLLRTSLVLFVAIPLINPPARGFKRSAGVYQVGQAPKYIINVDLNRDGIPDLITANFGGNSVSVLLGRTGGTFAPAVTYSVGQNPTSIAAADFNEDGNLDIAVANVNKSCSTCTASLSLLLGNGDGSFQPARSIAVDGMSAAVAAGDFNGDGHVDLASGDNGGGFVYVLLGAGDGSFAAPVGYPAGSVAHNIVASDFNGDGNLDLAVANYGSNNVSVLLGYGDGTFRAAVNYPVGTNPHNVIFTDLDGDGKWDLITADQNSNTISVLFGNGDGSFRAAVTYASSPNPASIAALDYNNDGHIDLAVTNSGCIYGNPGCSFSGTGTLLFRNNGSGGMQSDVTYAKGTGSDAITAGDFNGDGKTDLAIARLSSSTVEVLLGSGDGTFH